MADHSGPGERAESLGVRRSVELPEADIDAAGDLAPADASGSAEENETEDEAEQKAVESPASETEAAPKDAAAPAKEDATQALAAAAQTQPDAAVAVDDGPPPDRPNKPVLAAVAIGGAVVLAIPILLIGTGSHHGKKHPTTAAADRVLPGAEQQPPPGAFVSTSPTPTPLASPSKKAKPKASKKASPTPSGKPSKSGKVRAQSAVSNERPSASAPRSLVVHAPHDIYPGQTVRTSRIAMTMQSGGDLVLRDKSNKIIWSTGTHRRGVYAEFQTDGNLVLYAGDRQAVWGAGSFGHDKSTMVFQSDYNVVIIDAGGHPVWATGTNR